jgi:hypothetical protein
MEPRRASASWVFKETEYLLSSCVSGDWLEVTVEETVSSSTWKGKFEAKRMRRPECSSRAAHCFLLQISRS